MHQPSFTRLTAALCILLQPLAWADEITFFTDGQCQNQINAWDSQRDVQVDGSYSGGNRTGLTIYGDAGLRGETPFTFWPHLSFPGAEAEGGGYDVFFKFPENPGCTNILMRDYLVSGRNNLNVMGGAMVAWAEKDNCLYAHIPTGSNIFNTFCCGGDCDQVNMGSHILYKRDTNEVETPKETLRRETSLTARAARAIRDGKSALKNMKRDDHQPQCSTVDQSGNPVDANSQTPYRKSGPQVALINTPFTCQQGDCHVDNTYGVSTSMTVSSSSSFSYEMSEGLNVGITAGTNFLVEAEVSTDFSLSASQAWEKSTGQDYSRGQSKQTTVSLNSKSGQSQLLTFVPTVLCWDSYLMCDGTISTGEFQWCEGPNGEQAEGEPVFVSIGTR